MSEINSTTNAIALSVVGNEPRVDSRLVATELGVDHKNTRELVDNYCLHFEERLAKGDLSLTDIIEFAVQASLDGKNEIAIKTLNFIDESYPRELPYILHAARMEIMKNFQLSEVVNQQNNLHNEFAVVHYWFRNNCNKVIPGGVIEKHKKIKGYNPDFFVNVYGEVYPVECKKIFNDRSLNQLTDYMNAYKSKHGYAVALSLKTNLPPNITFIKCLPDTAARWGLAAVQRQRAMQ